jgi:aminopeptidase N/puromycin-sensitive aminopeptidase
MLASIGKQPWRIVSDTRFPGKNVVNASDISVDDKKEVATFTFPQTIKTGKGQLKTKFVGVLNDKLKGY